MSPFITITVTVIKSTFEHGCTQQGMGLAAETFPEISGGLFGMERYGLDVKWMFPINSWLALDAQTGVTGFCSMAVDWECSKMERVSALAGVRVYLEK